MDGIGAALALVSHDLATGASNARVNIANGILEGLHYKNETVFPCEKFITRFTKCINILDSSEDEALTPKQKVDKLFEKIQSNDQKLLAAAAVVQNKYPRDFAAAATEMGARILVLYKNVQAKRVDQSVGYRKRQVSAIDSRSNKFHHAVGSKEAGEEATVEGVTQGATSMVVDTLVTTPHHSMELMFLTLTGRSLEKRWNA